MINPLFVFNRSTAVARRAAACQSLISASETCSQLATIRSTERVCEMCVTVSKGRRVYHTEEAAMASGGHGVSPLDPNTQYQ